MPRQGGDSSRGGSGLALAGAVCLLILTLLFNSLAGKNDLLGLILVVVGGSFGIAMVYVGMRRIEARNDKQESTTDSSALDGQKRGFVGGIGWLLAALVIAGLLTAVALSVFTEIQLVILLAYTCYWLAFFALLIAVLNKFAPAPSGKDRFGPTNWAAIALLVGVLITIGVVLTSFRGDP